MKPPRRKFLHLAAGAAALPAVSRIARAQTYPTHGLGCRRGTGRQGRSPENSNQVATPRWRPAGHRLYCE